MAAFIDPTPFSNPPRTEEIAVAGASGVGGGVLAGFGLVLLVAGLLGGFPPFILVVALIATVIGLGLTARSLTEHLRWHPLTVHFERSRLGLGSSTPVTIERRARRALPDSERHVVRVSVTCTEWVRYTVGTDTRTDTRSVYEHVVPVEGTIQANTFVGRFDLEIPVDSGAPSLDLGHNRVFWKMEIELAPISSVGGEQDVDLTVNAELDRRHRRFTDAPPPPSPQDA